MPTYEAYKTLSACIDEMVRRSCTGISDDVMALMRRAFEHEESEAARRILSSQIENAERSQETQKPLCQSPGYPTVYVSFGERSVPSQDLRKLWGEALVAATRNCLMRPSVVHPLTRHNPGDNSGVGVPNFEFDYVPGQEYLEMLVSFKGCGAELANVMKIFTVEQLKRDQGYAGLKRWVLEAVADGGGKPCPPCGIGIGLGGQMDVACKLARRAISVRRWDDIHPDPLYRELEEELLENGNRLGIGPAGIGGRTTLLAVKIEGASTHTAICPAAVTFHCGVARRAGVRLYPNGRVESTL